MAAAQSQRVKKYQLDPETDPSVKNAIYAKNKREKIKLEDTKLKEINKELKMKYEFLKKQNRLITTRQNKLIVRVRVEELISMQMRPQGESTSINTGLQSVMQDLNNKHSQKSGKPTSCTSGSNVMTSEAHSSSESSDFEFDLDASFSSQESLGEGGVIPFEEIQPSLTDSSMYAAYIEPKLLVQAESQAQPPANNEISLENYQMIQQNSMPCSSNLCPVLKSMALLPKGG